MPPSALLKTNDNKSSLTFVLRCSWWEPNSLSYNMKLPLQLLFISGRSNACTFAHLFLPDAFLQCKKGKRKANFLTTQQRTEACRDMITREQSRGRDP